MNRESHITELNKIILSHGFKLNSYGIFHKENYTIDTRKNNLKISIGEFKAVSKPLIKVETAMLEKWLKIHNL